MTESPRPRSSLRLALLFSVLLAPLHAELEFTGLFITSQQSSFALTEKTSGETGWRKIGQTFAGAEITGYDPKDDTLSLRQDGATVRLRLKDAKVKDAGIEISGTATLGHGEKIDVIRGVFDRENVFPLSDGLVCRITPTRQPDGNLLYRAVFERTDDDGKPEKTNSLAVIVLPDQPFNLQVGDVGFSFTPKPASTP